MRKRGSPEAAWVDGWPAERCGGRKKPRGGPGACCLSGTAGSVFRDDRARVELVVQADPRDVAGEIRACVKAARGARSEREQRIEEGVFLAAEIIIEIFELDAPVRRKAVLTASADGP